MTRLETLKQHLLARFDPAWLAPESYGELTLEVPPDAWVSACTALRDEATLRFESLTDLCGVDYSAWGTPTPQATTQPAKFAQRYAVVVHLLSITHNWRLRVRTFTPDDAFPVLASLVEVWPCANWFEREAFDLYGIVFEGHPDLRRILTDYGFIGHPFRKDFPISGYVEMRYDDEQQRIVYQPVTIEPRENIPRVIRENGYAQGR